tara:strand:+ start:26 stop:775 length:750 start_codon:yes stop_codon:yes gene_type:complete
MKFINKFKSLNYNSRKFQNIKYIIIHYTALKNYNEAISYLCDKDKKVSSHYLISQEGKVYILVPEKKRAWHAGISYWENDTDINSLSIGIELDYSHTYSNNKYTKKMIRSLCILLKTLIKKYNISSKNILGHSDISPFRKNDPGPNFPWKKLIKFNIIFDPFKESPIKIIIVKKWFSKNKFKSKHKISLFIFSFIGFDTRSSLLKRSISKRLIKVYQERYIKTNISGKIDEITYNHLIKHFVNLVLTKK